MSESDDLGGDDLAGDDDVVEDDASIEDEAQDAVEDVSAGDDSVAGAPTAKAVLEYLARAVVGHPDAVHVDVEEGRPGSVTLNLHVADGDLGRVIGKRGRVANAIRTLVRAAAARDDTTVSVEFVE